MSLLIELPPEQEAQLLVEAQARGLSPTQLVQDALREILAKSGRHAQQPPKHSLYGLLAEHGTAPSAEDIDENRREMFASFGRDDIA